MKIIFLTFVFSLACQSLAQANFEQSLKQADKNKHDIVVLIYGSDWRGGGNKAAQLLLKNTQLKDQYNLCPVDMKEGLSDTQVAELKEKNKLVFKAVPVERIRSFPALLYFDHKGLPIELLANFSEIPQQKVVEKIQSMQQRRERRDQAWSKARKAQKIEKATVLGAGLSHVEPRFIRSYSSIVKQLKRLDPKDQSGYNARYNFDTVKFRNMVLKGLGSINNLDAKKTDTALSRIREQLKNDKFTSYQRQQIQAIKFGICRVQFKKHLDPKYADIAIQTLKDLIAIDPKSALAINAKYLISQFNKTIIMAQSVSKASQALKDRDFDSFTKACLRYNSTRKEQFGSTTLKEFKPQQQLLSQYALIETGGRIPYSTGESVLRGLSDCYHGMIFPRSQKDCAITLEFPQQKKISSIQLIPFDKWNNAFPLKWRVLSSTDGKTWQQVASFDKPKTKKVLIFETKDLNARFIKVTGEEGKRYSLGLYNFIVYGRHQTVKRK